MIDPSSNVHTILGSSYGYSGMGGPASAAGIEYPNGVCVDASGNYYVSDNYADAAYEVNGTTGIITNVCGHGAQGCTGDGGPGGAATMELPMGVAVDASGNIYIADYGNNRIRKVNAATGIVTTLTGGIYGFSPNGTPASTCAWSSIQGVCVDGAGNVYISDAGNHVVRMISASGLVRTVAGDGSAGYSGDGGLAFEAKLSSPAGLYINSARHLFICDQNTNVVRVVDFTTDKIYTLAGTGTGGFSGDGGDPTAAQLFAPTGVWQDGTGNIYIADAGNQRIRKIVGSAYRQVTQITEPTDNQFKIYPNPSAGTFIIDAGQALANATIEVYNMVGEKVYTGAVSNQMASITIDQPSGIYNIVLASAATRTVQQIMIQR